MTDKTRAIAVTALGAAAGAAAGYLFFTDAGRSWRRQLEPALEDFSRELNSFRTTVQKFSGVANEGWKLLNDALGEGGSAPYPSPQQTSPF